MRYFAQFLVPALIIIGVFLLFSARSRKRREPDESEEPDSDTGTFIAILLIGAAVLIGLAVVFQDYWAL